MSSRPSVSHGAGAVTSGSRGPAGTSAPATRPVRVLIVDGSDFVRQGIRAILAEVPGIAVVGTAESAAEGIDLGLNLRPEVILMDGSLPDRGGYEATRRLVGECQSAAVIILSSFADAEHALDAFACGARGYISKDVDRAELVAAIRRAAAGETSVDPILGARLLRALAAIAPATVQPDALTPRELDVLRLIATGRTNKEIASRLFVAVGTVKVHIERIFGKLGTSTRSEAAVRAIQLGIVETASVSEPAAGGHWDISRETIQH